jgi:redox-sensitive bicupin YhaK (pirin superfamily)
MNMYQIRRANERGHANHGWLDTWYTFSFSDYYDPAHMGFRSLRVMNEDRVDAGQGFGTHPHRDMEIVTYILEGELQHRDNMGNGSVLRAGEFQHMTAGTGITHSEFNPSPKVAAHLYQIWLLPRQKGLKPGYDQRIFPAEEKNGKFRVVASPDGADGSLTIQQDARIFLGEFKEGGALRHALAAGRHGWLQVLRGSVRLGRETLQAGDGVAISDESSVEIQGLSAGEVMLFDLA